MSLTDEIYRELSDGLGKGLDWKQFLDKHSGSKGPLYSAIGRFFTEVGTKIVALNEERSRVQSELDQAGLMLDSVKKKIIEAQSNNASVEERKTVLNEEVETLEAKLAEKRELAEHLAELERLGFNIEKLKQLQDVLREMGAKHGLKGKEAVSKFFADLKDYEAVLDAESQLKRLKTQIETRKLEAETWRAKEEALKRKYDDLNEALGAVRALRTRGVKISQIITWHRILNRFQTVEEFDQSLAQYGDMARLLNARKEETENYELRLATAQSQVETLEKQRAKIEGAIDVLKVAGVKEVKKMTEEAIKGLKAVATTEIGEVQAVGLEIRKGFGDYFAQLDALSTKIFEIGQEFERTRQKLQKYEGVKAALESHAAASEQPNEHVSK